jgi:hypothetical protein
MATVTADPTARRRQEDRASRGLWGDAFVRLMHNGPAIVGLVLITVFVLAAVLAPLIAPYGPLEGSLANRLQPPSREHLMGTDLQGRDELSRILYGAQVSLFVGVGSVMMALAMGGLIGAAAEMALASNVGVDLVATSHLHAQAFLFGEDQSRYLIATAEPETILAAAEAAGVHAIVCGQAGGDAFASRDLFHVPLAELRAANEGWLPALMS